MALVLTKFPQASAPDFEVAETSQEAPSTDAGTRKRAWFFQGMGLAALMLIGIYSMGGSPSGSEKPSGHDAALAFHPVVPGLRTGGLRPMMTPARTAGLAAAAAIDSPEAKLPGDVIDFQGKKETRRNAMSLATERHHAATALASERHEAALVLASERHDAALAVANQRHDVAMATAKRSAGVGLQQLLKHPRAFICMLGTTAMDPEADAGQLASVFTVMPEEDQKTVQALKIDVLAKAQSMAGVTAPLGFFDPLGFCTGSSEGKLCFYREVEVKHGRVAMLASLGFLVGEQFHPLFGGNVDVPSYIAFQQTPLQTFWPAVVAAIAVPEIFSVFDFNPPFNSDDGEKVDAQLWTMKVNQPPMSIRQAGDLGFDPLGLKPTDLYELQVMQTKELNNGRLAMLAAAGMVAQELVSGEKILGPKVLGTAL